MTIKGKRARAVVDLTFARVDPTLLRFGAVGALTTVLDFVLFSTLSGAFGASAATANLLSYSCGILVSFALNRAWTFRASGALLAPLMRFLASNAAGLALSTALVASLAMVVPAWSAKLVSVPVVFLWNYLVARYWVFQ